MIRVLITGACGFLGSHLSKHCLDLGYDVWGVDDFSTSSPDSKHAKELLKHNRFTFFNQNVCALDKVMKLRSEKFDIVLNFACPASPPRYMAMPTKTLMTCVAGTKNVLDIAARCDAIVVHASTSEVYGDPLVSPQNESYKGNVNMWGPRAVYDEGKRCAETLCWEHRKSGHDTRVVRIFNTYGPNMDTKDGRVVTNFITQALTNKDMTIYGTGEQTRSMCFVSDLVRGITEFASITRDRVPQIPMNIGSEREVTINALAENVLALVPDSTSKVIHVDAWQDDPMQRKPDLTLARETIGWKQSVSLADGLTQTIEYVKKEL